VLHGERRERGPAQPGFQRVQQFSLRLLPALPVG
jgi:hypothetical protein